MLGVRQSYLSALQGLQLEGKDYGGYWKERIEAIASPYPRSKVPAFFEDH